MPIIQENDKDELEARPNRKRKGRKQHPKLDKTITTLLIIRLNIDGTFKDALHSKQTNEMLNGMHSDHIKDYLDIQLLL